MQVSSQNFVGGFARFFRISTGDGALKNLFEVNFNLMYHHKIDPNIFNDYAPWERDIYLKLLTNEVEDENLQARQAAASSRVSKATRIRKPR